jgi:hypothetical protein
MAGHIFPALVTIYQIDAFNGGLVKIKVLKEKHAKAFYGLLEEEDA